MAERIPTASTSLQSSLFERAIREATIPACAVLCVYYAFMTWAYWISLAQPERTALCLLTGATSILFLVQTIRWHNNAPDSATVVTWVVVVIAVNNAVAMGLPGLESAIYGQVIVQAGLGFVGLRWSRFLALTGVILCAFVIGASQQGNVEFWYGNLLTISASTVLSVLLQWLSSRYRYHLNSARQESERQRQAAEENLASFQVEAKQREQLQERLAHAERLESLGLLAGGVAHDFNNLLAIVIGRASLMRELAVHSTMRVELEAIIDAGERAALLSRELLAYAGRGTTIVALLDLAGEVSGVCALARSSLPPGVELRVAESDEVMVVRADRGQVQQIVLNLIINAGDATAQRGGSIRVTVGREQLDEERAHALEPLMVRPAGAYCFLRVTDDGSGMSAETLKHVFDPFYTTKSNGRGLGLAAALGIARAHVGGFRVVSQENSGSDFTLYLPASDDALADVESTPRAPLTGDRSTILVVDDQDDVRRMLVSMLQNADYLTMDAGGGAAAVAMLEAATQVVQIAIVDMSMPEMDGEATFHALRRIRPDLPILLSSGFDAHEAAARLAKGFKVDFLAKPYRLVQLLDKLDELMQPAKDEVTQVPLRALPGRSEPPALAVIGKNQRFGEVLEDGFTTL